jgi:hypothetical protein
MSEQIKWSEMTPEQRDRLVAERVTGWKGEPEQMPKYTRSMDAAWEVLKVFINMPALTGKLIRHKKLFFEYLGFWQGSDAPFYYHVTLVILNTWTPERICIAALQAVGAEVDL